MPTHTACLADAYSANDPLGYRADALLVMTRVPPFEAFLRKKCIARYAVYTTPRRLTSRVKVLGIAGKPAESSGFGS